MGILAIAVLVVLLVYITAISVYDFRKSKKKLRERLRQSWGKKPEFEYKPGDLESIAGYYRNDSKKGMAGFSIDDITWRDLDMDELFIRLNATESTPGEETLYRLLRQPCFDPDVLKSRQKLIELFQADREEREAIQTALAKLGKKRLVNVTDCLFKAAALQSWKARTYKALSAFAILSPFVLYWSTGLGALLIVVSLATNMYVYYSRRFDIAADLAALSYIVRLARHAGRLIETGLRPPELQELRARLKSSYEKVKGVANRRFFLFFYSTGSIADLLVEYVKIMLLRELIDYEYLCNAIVEHQTELIEIYDAFGLLDSLLSIASFRESVPFYCVPELNKPGADSRRYLDFEELCHPLIRNAVPNSLATDRPVLVTGSNASGKSTFLKTVAINAILAQTFDTCLAHRYSSSFFATITSMAVRDNITNGESYFIAEIKSLKRILDYRNEEIPCLCLIDEVLRGTNTVERIASSSQLLLQLAGQECLCIAATHDLELTFILESCYRNVHFEEAITDSGIFFDYLLRDGRANSRNAIKLLRIMGYGEAIVNQAESRADRFESCGSWMDQ
jgi:DNA mismatch repair ATPase MutS